MTLGRVINELVNDSGCIESGNKLTCLRRWNEGVGSSLQCYCGRTA